MRTISFALLFVAVLAVSGANAATKNGLPPSEQLLFLAIDALFQANERPPNITPQANVDRIKPLMRQVVEAGAKADRAELNSLYPELGDHFLDDAVANARYILQFLDTRDDDAIIRAGAAFLRWQKWWVANKKMATGAIFNR